MLLVLPIVATCSSLCPSSCFAGNLGFLGLILILFLFLECNLAGGLFCEALVLLYSKLVTQHHNFVTMASNQMIALLDTKHPVVVVIYYNQDTHWCSGGISPHTNCRYRLLSVVVCGFLLNDNVILFTKRQHNCNNVIINPTKSLKVVFDICPVEGV